MNLQITESTSGGKSAGSFRPASSLGGIRRLRWELVSRSKTNPWIYMPLMGHWSRDLSGNFRGLNRNTQLLIDAYPRSANSFATFAFFHCQPSPVRVAHHLHSPAAITYATRNSIPTLTLLRDPVDACTSLLFYYPKFAIEQAFMDYVRYYEAVSRGIARLVMARFATATTDLASVFRAVNNKFGTSFAEFSNSPEDVAAVRERLKKQAERHYGDGSVDSGRNATPAAGLNSDKDSLSGYLEGCTATKVIARARALYSELLPQATV